MGLYGTQNGKLNFGQVLKHELHDFPGAEMAKAKILIKATGESQQVQFNPQTLTFVGNVSTREVPEVEGTSSDVVNVFAKPTITMSVELLFDAINDDGLIDHIKGGNFIKNSAKQFAKNTAQHIANGSKIFPAPYGDVSQQVDFFYDIMTNYKKRRIEFAWNQLSFVGDVESISVNVLLFDTSGNPTRAKISLSVKQVIEEQGVREIRSKPLTSAMNMLTRKG